MRSSIPLLAALLAAALAKLRKRQFPMWFNHLDSLEQVLRAAFNEKSADEQEPYWMLLFELLILQGKAQEFEDLGLEYAVAFEVSPPSWETYVNPIAAASKSAAPEKVQEAPAAQTEEGFPLKGVLSAASSNQIAELNAFAASRTEVPVDMSKVLRVDFAFTAAFFDTVKAIQLAGKRVILAGLNELNAALLEALGVNRYAILVRRKST
jgi:anti-anti-sigma regulatory factor